MMQFPLLLEKPQPGGPLGHPTDLYRARYRPGSSPELDIVDRVETLVDSSSDESQPVFLPDGDVAYHSLRGQPGVYRLEGPPVLHRRRIERFAVSPDGQDWAFVSDQKLYRHRPGQAPRPVPLPERQPREVAFAPDGSLLFSDRQGLWRAEPLELLVAGELRDFSLSAEGDRLVYLRGDAEGDQLRVRDAEGDRLVRHSSSEQRVGLAPGYACPRFSPDGSRILYCVNSSEGPWGPALQSDLRVVSRDGGASYVVLDDVLGVSVGGDRRNPPHLPQTT